MTARKPAHVRQWTLRHPAMVPARGVGDHETLPGFGGKQTAQLICQQLGRQAQHYPDPWGWWIEDAAAGLRLFVHHLPGTRTAQVQATAQTAAALASLDALLTPFS